MIRSCRSLYRRGRRAFAEQTESPKYSANALRPLRYKDRHERIIQTSRGAHMTRRLLLGLMAAHLGVQALAAQGPGKQIVKVGADMNLPLSAAVKAGGLVYLSGTLPTDEKGQVIQGDIKAQTTRALDN